VNIVGVTTRTTTFGYDLDNNLTSIATPEGTVNYVYDPATDRHTETYTANSDIAYTYDQLGRLSTVSVKEQNGIVLGTQLVTTYFYTAVGNVDHITYANGTETDYTYDSLSRVLSVTNKEGSQLLSSYTYTVNLDGLRTGVSEQELESDNTTSTVTKAWTYDADQRLTQEAVTVSGSVNYASYTDTYTMDLVGNRLAKSHTTGGQAQNIAYVYNNNDQLTTETSTINGNGDYSTTYQYDANGSETNLNKTISQGSSSTPETDVYGYDLRNQLSSATISRTENGQSVSITSSYLYNENGIRVQSTVTTTIGNGLPTTTTTQFLNDLDNPTGYSQVLEEHTNGSSSPSMSYVLGLAVLSQAAPSGATGYLMGDVEGSTRLVVDSSGAITARVAYDAYGNVLGTTYGVTNPPVTAVLYVAQHVDGPLALYYNRARYYATSDGRFTSMDSLQRNLQSPSHFRIYVYGGDNPLRYDDPDGHDFSLTGLAVTAGISGGINALLVTTYGIAKRWSVGQIAKAAGLSFVVGALAGALAYGAAWGLATALVSGGVDVAEAGATAWTATGLMAGPSGVGLSIVNLMEAEKSGDSVDQAFAIVNLGLASLGFVTSHWAAFSLAAEGTAAELAQVTLNKISGDAAVEDFIANARANGMEVAGTGVYVETPFGNRIIDVVIRDPETGLYYGVEIKSTQGAFDRFDAAARQQFAGDRWINQWGGQVFGQWAGRIPRIEGTCKILWNLK
jgi:RHS repeat-associated protein